jgi:putative membrane-bound dehydrogenase-like protein
MSRLTTFCALLLVGHAAGGDEPPRREALSPDDEAATFRLADSELTVELAAAEPLIDSPVAVAWDADGRMYVAEMSDYPVGPAPGRVRLLTDRDGDGRYDDATVFAENLNFPNSVLCWRGGVFVTAAPELLFLKDADGDGRADERRVVWTGFAEGNQQLRANGLVWGLDNWIYGANGRSDGEIRRPGAPTSEAVSIRTRDFRFSPDGQRFEAIAGQSQFGQTRDDWGRRFLSWNTIPVRQALLDPSTLAAHPRLATTVRDIADPADTGRVYPISSRPKTFNREATDYYNALCGLSIYRGDALGEKHYGNAFVGESLTNLVHRRVLKPDGPTFVSCRGEAEREFLASTDSWFHPVNTATGPDGALYVVDFYRRWVEHPQFVAPALRGDVDWREGERHGRIWRIRRAGPAAGMNSPRLSNAGAAELVAELSRPNGWRRDTAQRLLVERAEPASLELLRETALKSESDLARLHALWTLEGLNGLDDSVLLAALADRRAELREQALRLAAARPTRSAQLTSTITAMGGDPSLAVRFRLALSLDGVTDEEKLAVWAGLARQTDADPWLWLSVSGALDDRTSWRFLKRLVQEEPAWLRSPMPQQAAFVRQIAAMLHDEGDVAELLSLVKSAAPTETGAGHLAMVAGLSQASLADNRSLRQWLAGSEATKTTDAVRMAIDAARRVAIDERASVFERCDAVRIVGLDDEADAVSVLLGLLTAQQPQEVQSMAAAVLGQMADSDAARRMFAEWNTYTAATRQAVAGAALRSADATGILVEALEQGEVSVMELDPGLRDALASVRDPSLGERVKKILAAAAPADRQEVLAKYQAALAQSGDRRRGATIFRQNCLTCHALQGLGHRVGADLSGISARPRATLLEDVLDPSRQVTPNFMSYTVVTEDGQILVGLLAAENAQAVTLRRAEGIEETVPRGRIEQLRASGKSLMPDGFEQKFDVSAMADLLEFLTHPSRELLELGSADRR